MPPETLTDGVTLYPGDCLAVLAELPENSIDSVVTDPPYHFTSIVKRFGAEDAAPAKSGKTGAFKRASAGFMGKQWDGGEIAFEPETWAAVYRVLKPGGHLLAFGAPKNFGFMQYAMSQAGFEIRDVIAWIFGSGFPKSHNIGKAIDAMLGAERETGPVDPSRAGRLVNQRGEYQTEAGWSAGNRTVTIDPPATDAARQWEGWGTALKPAYEPIIMGRKPLVGTVAQNVQEHGTGAINIDGCRIASSDDLNGGAYSGEQRKRDEYSSTDTTPDAVALSRLNRGIGEFKQPPGRWPANVIHDGSEEVVGAFPAESSVTGSRTDRSRAASVSNTNWLSDNHQSREHTDSGSPARFFYSAKADADDRLGSKHPTIKPVDLMQYLVRLVTPKGGLVLDPFAGTGTTGEAAIREGMRAILIEREAEYQDDIRRRMKLALSGPDERQRESIKAKGLTEAPGPLFADLWKEPYWNEDGTAPLKSS